MAGRGRALIILDHGSRLPEAHAALERLAGALRRRAPGLIVCAAHLEQAEPTLAQAIERCAAEGASAISVHPLFLAPGRHLTRDIPEQLEAARRARPELEIQLLAALGTRDELADLILATLAESS